jgi:hypothetical protein
MSLKLIPGVGAERPAPALAQLILGPWKVTGDFYAGSGSFAYTKSEQDPLYKLPSLKVLDAMYLRGDMTISVGEMKVLKDLLK